ncbi:hypothetical protein R6Q59_029377 [Mikania micrantha]
MAQIMVLRIMSMTDDKVKKKAIEAAADILGVDSIAAELNNQELVVVGEMDTVAVVKKLKKVTGMVDIVSVGPAVVEEPSPDDHNKKEDEKKKNKQDNKVEVKRKKRSQDEEFMEF